MRHGCVEGVAAAPFYACLCGPEGRQQTSPQPWAAHNWSSTVALIRCKVCSMPSRITARRRPGNGPLMKSRATRVIGFVTR